MAPTNRRVSIVKQRRISSSRPLFLRHLVKSITCDKSSNGRGAFKLFSQRVDAAIGNFLHVGGRSPREKFAEQSQNLQAGGLCTDKTDAWWSVYRSHAQNRELYTYLQA